MFVLNWLLIELNPLYYLFNWMLDKQYITTYIIVSSVLFVLVVTKNLETMINIQYLITAKKILSQIRKKQKTALVYKAQLNKCIKNSEKIHKYIHDQLANKRIVSLIWSVLYVFIYSALLNSMTQHNILRQQIATNRLYQFFLVPNRSVVLGTLIFGILLIVLVLAFNTLLYIENNKQDKYRFNFFEFSTYIRSPLLSVSVDVLFLILFSLLSPYYLLLFVVMRMGLNILATLKYHTSFSYLARSFTMEKEEAINMLIQICNKVIE